jgi:hypothetical protein
MAVLGVRPSHKLLCLGRGRRDHIVTTGVSRWGEIAKSRDPLQGVNRPGLVGPEGPRISLTKVGGFD